MPRRTSAPRCGEPPQPTEPSEVITNGPISAVQRTCVPPQSSRENPGISITRTSSPYFSPKSIIAPSLRASSIGVSNVCTGWFAKTCSLTRRSTSFALLARQRLAVGEVEAELVGADGRARLPDVIAEHFLERLCRRWVAVWFAIVGKRALQGTTARTRSPSAKPSPRNAAPGRRRTGTPPPARARAPVILELDEAGVADLAAAAGIERRFAQLREEAAVARALERADLRQRLRLLVAHELAS